jgi:hypothetical protein
MLCLAWAVRSLRPLDHSTGHSISQCLGNGCGTFEENLEILFRRGSGLLLRRPAFFGGWLAVALIQVGQDDAEDELLFPVIVKLDDDIFFAAGKNAPETELSMLNLGALREGGFGGHKSGNLVPERSGSIVHSNKADNLVGICFGPAPKNP